MSRILPVLLICFGYACGAAERERVIEIKPGDDGKTPVGFRSALTGVGKPGRWEVALDEAPTAFPSVTGNAPPTSQQRVLAQLASDPTSEHYPLLIADSESFGDFTFTAKVKVVSGTVEQMGGLVFRLQDEKNYYAIRINTLNGNFRFYKVVGGERTAPVGPELPIARGVWHEIAVTCKGNQMQFFLDGREIMPAITDTSFSVGRVGFFTKADSVSYFTGARVSFTQREKLAEFLVRDTLQHHDRLKGLKIISTTSTNTAAHVVAASNPADIGKPAADEQKRCLQDGSVFYYKDGKIALVTMPLHDRNGDVVAAVQLAMESFPGQTQNNAVGRALLVVREMETRVPAQKELVE
ncbi:MAG: hypothetical protein HY301_09160 [Verrucomicrobia bacterium]|nr:hypothetical protein [Verrucomicrobiota bacterium]